MKVLHVIPSVSSKHGGPSAAIKAISRALKQNDVKVTIATTDDDGPTSRLSVPLATQVQENDATYFFFKRDFLPYKVSLGLAKWLRDNVNHFDVVHIHALFSFSSTAAARIARRQNIPYVVRPLGVLNQWGIQNRRRFPKLISVRLVELPILQRSSAIHYTSEAERSQAILLSSRLAEHYSVVIPLPLETHEPMGPGTGTSLKSEKGHVILFFSRIDRMKGLELLLDSFELVRNTQRDSTLVIAGEGDHLYVRELQNRPSARRNASHIVWTGHLSGNAKANAFASADLFVLPSRSENFGIAAAESLAAGVPTIVSEEVGLSADIVRYDAGIVVKRDKHQLAEAINSVLSNKGRAETIASNGRRLVAERYSPQAVGKALCQLYESISALRASPSR